MDACVDRHRDLEWQNQMRYELTFLKAFLALQTMDVQAWTILFAEVRKFGNRSSLFPLSYCIRNHFEVSLLGGPLHFYGRLNLNKELLSSCPDVIEMLRSTFTITERAGYLPVARAELSCEQDVLDQATRHLLAGLAEALAAGNDGALAPGIFTMARIRRARGDMAGALEVVERATLLLAALETFTEREQRLPSLIEVLNLQALVCQAMKQNARAVEFLDRSLAMAESNGYLRIIIDEGAPMLALLGRLVWRARSRPDQIYTSITYVCKLQRLIKEKLLNNRRQERLANTSTRSHSSLLFTKKEWDVLQLLAGGGSYREIAAQLNIALPTLKTHVSKIFSKLGVKNRTLAVRLAAELHDNNRDKS